MMPSWVEVRRIQIIEGSRERIFGDDIDGQCRESVNQIDVGACSFETQQPRIEFVDFCLHEWDELYHAPL